MEEDRQSFIRRQIQEGKTRHQVRSELISHGYGSGGFDTEYSSALTALGVEEPAPVSGDMPYVRSEQEDLQKSETRHRKRRSSSLTSALLAVLVLALAGVVFAYLNHERTGGEGGDINVSESITRTKVDSTVASVRLYGGRMGTYDGVCRDVTVVAPVECREDGSSFVLFASLGGGIVYCVDNTGYAGEGIRPLGVSCNK